MWEFKHGKKVGGKYIQLYIGGMISHLGAGSSYPYLRFFAGRN